MVWLPDALRIPHEEEPAIEITLASQSSPDLAGALMRGKMDVARFTEHLNVVANRSLASACERFML